MLPLNEDLVEQIDEAELSIGSSRLQLVVPETHKLGSKYWVLGVVFHEVRGGAVDLLFTVVKHLEFELNFLEDVVCGVQRDRDEICHE